MSDIGSQLRDADPLIHEPGLSPDHALRIRQAIVATARQSGGRARMWQPALTAAVAMLILAAVVGADRWQFRASRGQGGDDAHATGPVGPPSPARQQLQFVTAGGTRLIWVFDSRFKP
jgi:hypothetical protein